MQKKQKNKNKNKKTIKKGKTLVVIRSNLGNIFGGYTDINWETPRREHGKFLSGNGNSFIYLLKHFKNEMKLPVKYQCLKNDKEICCDANYGPAFGEGWNLFLGDACNQEGSCFTNSVRNDSYEKTTNNTVLAGSYCFYVTDYEVFKVQP